ncbi:MAG: anhydro-N-acetylmuramic acid kinase, partial [Bacteroidales bacterium]|nr:anhydro-N-acetylmuramic acid kinase [Bacteroidales bacterium]
QEGDKRKAYDICPVNIVLNYLASFLGMPFDRDGETARSGKVEELLLQTLNSLPYYVENQRKSLGKEWVRANIFPLICNSPYSPQDLLATYTEHVAVQLAKHITGRTLVSGGGAYNRLLVEKLRAKTSHEIIIPDKATVDFKEAMIFAFLGVKRVRKEINCLASVTGAKKDSCSGTVVYWNNI